MAGTLFVRKTLLLALGSTGMHVAEQLAEHLNWQYGSFEKAAWVRILVLETAQPQTILGDRVLWGGMTKEEYLPYLTSPRTTGAEFGFYEWQDGPTLKDIDNPSDGAGNCRMLGRLCLFHPRTYGNIRRRVTEDLGHLQRLTPQMVADSLGEPGLSVQIHEGGTVVYVVGTLCGGTCSGGAADLGYLIDAWSANSARRQAIFTIPHPTLAHTLGPRYKKNAYYALRELNHYQQGNTAWVQRLPGSDTPYRNEGRPYDILRIMMPGGPSDEDVKSLNAMMAQYLAAAVGPAGFEIAASDVDALGKMVGAESIGFMRPLFSTMGVAALEYPGEHIQRAATDRLLAATFGRWARGRADEATVKGAFNPFGGTDWDGYLLRVTQGADAVAAGPVTEQFKSLADGIPPKTDDVKRLLRDVESRLSAQEAPGETQPGVPPTLIQVMQRNHGAMLQGLAAEVERFLDRRLFDLNGGPAFVRAALEQFGKELEGWEAASTERLPEYRQDADSLRGILDGQIGKVEKIEDAPIVWARQGKLAEAWEGFPAQATTYLTTELRAQAAAHLQRRHMLRELTEQYRRVTAQALRRVAQMVAAFEQEATGMERQWRDMAASSPSVNGKVYFEAEPPAARGTVTDEYYKLLRSRRWADEPAVGWDDAQKEAAAMRDVLQSLTPLRAELARDEGHSAFDFHPGAHTARERIPRDVLLAAEGVARGFFSPLREQVHIAEKAGPADVDTAVQASEPTLAVSAAQVSQQLAGVKGATPMAGNLAFMDLGATPDNPRGPIAEMAGRVRNNVELRRGITNSRDPFRLLILRERHGFTLGQMEGVVRQHAHDNHALQASEGVADFKFWHTRRDVDWVDPLIPPGQVESTEEAWLLTALLGHPADDALPWLPATKGEIDPGGWYQLVAGAFYVYYAPGVDASERGETLPLSFPVAVAKLLIPEYALLRRTLTMRFSTYMERHGAPHMVRVVDQALKSLTVFGVGDLDAKTAERIVRRAYRRNDVLTRAFFDFKTAGLTNPAEFAHLRRMQGMPIEDRAGEVYPSDGYYCPECHHLLGGAIEKLLEDQFLCPRCNSGVRYWP